MATEETIPDPNRCPFCGDTLPSPGKGFLIHLDEHPDCSAEFDRWRDRIADDIPGGWPG